MSGSRSWAMLVLLASAPQLQAQASRALPDSIPPVDGVSRSVAALLRLAPLHAAAERGRPGREIRIWLHYGFMAGPRPMLRIADIDGRVTGEMVHWWQAAPRSGTIDDSQADADFVRRMTEYTRSVRESAVREFGCAPPVRGPIVEACRAQPSPSPDWTALLARIDALDPWSLPDPRTLDPPLLAGQDGWDILVETRVGATYRAYDYWMPDSTRGPEASRARGLASVVWSVQR